MLRSPKRQDLLNADRPIAACLQPILEDTSLARMALCKRVPCVVQMADVGQSIHSALKSNSECTCSHAVLRMCIFVNFGSSGITKTLRQSEADMQSHLIHASQITACGVPDIVKSSTFLKDLSRSHNHRNIVCFSIQSSFDTPVPPSPPSTPCTSSLY